jgi:hypothetical protein
VSSHNKQKKVQKHGTAQCANKRAALHGQQHLTADSFSAFASCQAAMPVNIIAV